MTAPVPSFRRKPESTSAPGCLSVDDGTRPVFPAEAGIHVACRVSLPLPSFRLPPVFPAKAGIHVASRVSLRGRRHPSRLSGESRNPRRLPGVFRWMTSCLPSFWRKPESTSPAGCLYVHDVIPPVFPAKAGIHVASIHVAGRVSLREYGKGVRVQSGRCAPSRRRLKRTT